MPMNMVEKRIPGANPTTNRKKDSRILQPSRQVRKMRRKDKTVIPREMILMVLYRLILGIVSELAKFEGWCLGTHTV